MTAATDRLDWERDGKDWPNRASSRFVDAAGLRWHVQIIGQGPDLLLIHGTGASTHSWANIVPLLSDRFRLVIPDLPGHAFTGAPPNAELSLPGMSRALAGLLGALGVRPALVVGHSAGGPVLARMTLDGHIAPKAIVSINGAFMPFPGLARHIFPPLAKLIYLNPFVPRFFAWRASDPAAVAGVIRGTGSNISDRDLGWYVRLFRSPAHIDATLGMMANWDLGVLMDDLPKLATPLVLVACGNDRAVPADDAFRLKGVVKEARVVFIKELGHLAHEEKPDAVAAVILETAAVAGMKVPA